MLLVTWSYSFTMLVHSGLSYLNESLKLYPYVHYWKAGRWSIVCTSVKQIPSFYKGIHVNWQELELGNPFRVCYLEQRVWNCETLGKWERNEGRREKQHIGQRKRVRWEAITLKHLVLDCCKLLLLICQNTNKYSLKMNKAPVEAASIL